MWSWWVWATFMGLSSFIICKIGNSAFCSYLNVPRKVQNLRKEPSNRCRDGTLEANKTIIHLYRGCQGAEWRIEHRPPETETTALSKVLPGFSWVGMTSGHAGLFSIHCSCFKRHLSTLAIQQEMESLLFTQKQKFWVVATWQYVVIWAEILHTRGRKQIGWQYRKKHNRGSSWWILYSGDCGEEYQRLTFMMRESHLCPYSGIKSHGDATFYWKIVGRLETVWKRRPVI